jgi:hypothetical protein
VGDVHDELLELLGQLGYSVSTDSERYTITAPEGRELIFVGDFVDRGPGTPQVLRLVSGMVEGQGKTNDGDVEGCATVWWPKMESNRRGWPSGLLSYGP